MRTFEPSDVEIIRAAIRARSAEVRTAIPAMIESYDHTTQTCSCVLAVRIPTTDGTPEEIPPLTDVPVKWQRGGGYFCSMPLAKGDPGLLVFSETDFSAWRESGKVSDPNVERRHGLYGYFLPGGCADGGELADAAADALVIGKDGGDVMKIDATGFRLGATATAFAAKADVLDAHLTALSVYLAAHVHTSAAPGSPTTPPVAPPPTPSTTACTKVKIL